MIASRAMLLQAVSLLTTVKLFFSFLSCNCPSHGTCSKAEGNTPPLCSALGEAAVPISLRSLSLLQNTRGTAMSPFQLQSQQRYAKSCIFYWLHIRSSQVPETRAEDFQSSWSTWLLGCHHPAGTVCTNEHPHNKIPFPRPILL